MKRLVSREMGLAAWDCAGPDSHINKFVTQHSVCVTIVAKGGTGDMEWWIYVVVGMVVGLNLGYMVGIRRGSVIVGELLSGIIGGMLGGVAGGQTADGRRES